jgi:hypothetical protein
LEFSEKSGHAVVVECQSLWRFVFWDRAQYVVRVDLGGVALLATVFSQVGDPRQQRTGNRWGGYRRTPGE